MCKNFMLHEVFLNIMTFLFLIRKSKTKHNFKKVSNKMLQNTNSILLMYDM